MRKVIEAADSGSALGDDVTAEAAGPSTGPPVPRTASSASSLGDALERDRGGGQRNREEGRIVMIQAVLERSAAPA